MVYDWRMLLGRNIQRRQNALFIQLSGNIDEVARWNGSSIMKYYLYLEKMVVLRKEQEKSRGKRAVNIEG